MADWKPGQKGPRPQGNLSGGQLLGQVTDVNVHSPERTTGSVKVGKPKLAPYMPGGVAYPLQLGPKRCDLTRAQLKALRALLMQADEAGMGLGQ